jgi:hypothetical protein
VPRGTTPKARRQGRRGLERREETRWCHPGSLDVRGRGGGESILGGLKEKEGSDGDEGWECPGDLVVAYGWAVLGVRRRKTLSHRAGILDVAY